MPRPKDRESLLKRSYRELQALAKKAGIRANQSRIAIIDQLLAGSSDAADVNTPVVIPSASDTPHPSTSEDLRLGRPATPAASANLRQSSSHELSTHEDTQEAPTSPPRLEATMPQTLSDEPSGHDLATHEDTQEDPSSLPHSSVVIQESFADEDVPLDRFSSPGPNADPVQSAANDSISLDRPSPRPSPPPPCPASPPAQPSPKPLVLNSNPLASPGLPLDVPYFLDPRTGPVPSSNHGDLPVPHSSLAGPAASHSNELDRLPSYESDVIDPFGGLELQYPSSPSDEPPKQPSTFVRYFSSPAPSSGPMQLTPSDDIPQQLPSPSGQAAFARESRPSRETTPLCFPASSDEPELPDSARQSPSSLREEEYTGSHVPVRAQDDYAENQQAASSSDIEGGSDKENQAIVPPLTSADLMGCRGYILDYSSGSEDPYTTEPIEPTPASPEDLEQAVDTMAYLHLRYLYYTHHARERRREAKDIIRKTKVARRLLHQERANTDRMRTFAVYHRPAPTAVSTEDLYGWPMELRKNDRGEWEEIDSEDEAESEDEDGGDNEGRRQERRSGPRRGVDGSRTGMQGPSRNVARFVPGRASTLIPENEASTSTLPPMGRNPVHSSKEAPTRTSKRKADTLHEPASPQAEYPNKRLRLGNHTLSEAPAFAEESGPVFVGEELGEDVEDAIDETTIEMLLNPEFEVNRGVDDREEGPILPAMDENLDDIPLFGPGAYRRRAQRSLSLFV